MISLQQYVETERKHGNLVVQPRMGFSDPTQMRTGIARVAQLGIPAATTLTLDSYTRVARHDLVQQALRERAILNGYPIVDLPEETTAYVTAAADEHPVQVRHGSADPRKIFSRMGELGMFDTEGGPASRTREYPSTLPPDTGEKHAETSRKQRRCARRLRTSKASVDACSGNSAPHQCSSPLASSRHCSSSAAVSAACP